ncbi:MAG: B12-binding domain-containing radical SAM protein [Oscillospiraceae bacterium]|nr:B12-binding domain-containing radical SAM protein [Oscillospiraceae bacterium]MCL2277969.1 B12-binding domain-containing radical SAM protein [Oscillospiraceae bacterium]
MLKAVEVLFVYPDFLEKTRNVRNILGSYSEGLASLSAVLKKDGHNVSLYHQTYMPDRREFIDTIRKHSPDIIGISIRTSAFPFAKEMIGWLNDELPDICVMAGMYHASLAPQEVIDVEGVDAVCIGEGEYVCLDFVNYFAKHGKINTAADSFWVKDSGGTVHKNPLRPFIADLDELPFPDLELFDYTNLRSNVEQNTAEVIVSRGCVYSCTYCANAELRNLYPNKSGYARFRSPENSIKLLERVLEKDPKIECFSFNDAILNANADWFYEFAALYRERIGKRFVCNLRVELITEEMVEELAKTGCYLVTIGIESGNEELRTKYLMRTMKNDHIIKVSHLLKNAGIIVNTYNIIGLPYETPELTLETIKLNAQMHTDNIVISYFQPFPNTRLRAIAEQAGFIDPSVRPNDLVQLRMPGYKRSDIIYFRYSFLMFIRKYRKLYQSYSGERLEREIARLDSKILGKNHPRGLIGVIRQKKYWLNVFIKRTVSRTLPGVYKALRRLRDKKSAIGRLKT